VLLSIWLDFSNSKKNATLRFKSCLVGASKYSYSSGYKILGFEDNELVTNSSKPTSLYAIEVKSSQVAVQTLRSAEVVSPHLLILKNDSSNL